MVAASVRTRELNAVVAVEAKLRTVEAQLASAQAVAGAANDARMASEMRAMQGEEEARKLAARVAQLECAAGSWEQTLREERLAGEAAGQRAAAREQALLVELRAALAADAAGRPAQVTVNVTRTRHDQLSTATQTDPSYVRITHRDSWPGPIQLPQDLASPVATVELGESPRSSRKVTFSRPTGPCSGRGGTSTSEDDMTCVHLDIEQPPTRRSVALLNIPGLPDWASVVAGSILSPPSASQPLSASRRTSLTGRSNNLGTPNNFGTPQQGDINPQPAPFGWVPEESDRNQPPGYSPVSSYHTQAQAHRRDTIETATPAGSPGGGSSHTQQPHSVERCRLSHEDAPASRGKLPLPPGERPLLPSGGPSVPPVLPSELGWPLHQLPISGEPPPHDSRAVSSGIMGSFTGQKSCLAASSHSTHPDVDKPPVDAAHNRGSIGFKSSLALSQSELSHDCDSRASAAGSLNVKQPVWPALSSEGSVLSASRLRRNLSRASSGMELSVMNLQVRQPTAMSSAVLMVGPDRRQSMAVFPTSALEDGVLQPITPCGTDIPKAPSVQCGSIVRHRLKGYGVIMDIEPQSRAFSISFGSAQPLETLGNEMVDSGELVPVGAWPDPMPDNPRAPSEFSVGCPVVHRGRGLGEVVAVEKNAVQVQFGDEDDLEASLGETYASSYMCGEETCRDLREAASEVVNRAGQPMLTVSNPSAETSAVVENPTLVPTGAPTRVPTEPAIVFPVSPTTGTPPKQPASPGIPEFAVMPIVTGGADEVATMLQMVEEESRYDSTFPMAHALSGNDELLPPPPCVPPYAHIQTLSSSS
eukprot:Hpha_TRINITY_DN8800_c0_g2::TRINITY_DN8800_c0_g2_i4::g.141395::m.141395